MLSREREAVHSLAEVSNMGKVSYYGVSFLNAEESFFHIISICCFVALLAQRSQHRMNVVWQANECEGTVHFAPLLIRFPCFHLYYFLVTFLSKMLLRLPFGEPEALDSLNAPVAMENRQQTRQSAPQGCQG